MPLYQYKCTACGHSFEKLQKHSDPSPLCPDCNKATEKQLTAPGHFDLRGGGYYQTDFK